jgi:Zn-dependent protease with chaperone function
MALLISEGKMSHDDFKLRINTSTDRLNFVLHGAANAATCVAVATFTGAPLLLGGAFLATAAYNYFYVPRMLKKMRDSLPPTPLHEIPAGSKDLPDYIRHVAKDMGLKKVPALYVVEKPPSERRQHSSRYVVPSTKNWFAVFLHAFDARFGRYMNAAAYGTDYPGILVTTPLLEQLTASEEKGFIVHEIMHLAGDHTRKQLQIGMFGAIARTGGGLNFLASFLNYQGAFAVVSGAVALLGARRFLIECGFDPADAKQKKIIKSISGWTANGVVLGALYATGGLVPVLVAWGVSKGILIATRLVEARFSRCCEFQSDRGAGEYTQEPEALISGLAKAVSYNAKLNPGMESEDYTQGNVLLRPFKWAKALFWSHPHVNRRYEALHVVSKQLKQSAPTAIFNVSSASSARPHSSQDLLRLPLVQRTSARGSSQAPRTEMDRPFRGPWSGMTSGLLRLSG